MPRASAAFIFPLRVVCAAPAYLEKRGTPKTPADLARHEIVLPTGASTALEWRFGQTQKTSVRVDPRLYCTTIGGALAAVRAGWGVTRVLSYQIAPAVAAGEICPVLTHYEEEPLPIHVVHPEGRRAPAKVRSFVDLAVQRLRSNKHLG